VAELIELYDVPEPVNSQKARVTKLFFIKYSKASVVANTIKDAYRDLLSSNDRALQDASKQGKQPRGDGMTVISMSGFGEEPSPSDTRTSARFDGKLSFGVDDVTNTLLVSTEGDNLMAVVAGMIESLDDAAKPVSEIRVVKLNPHTDGSRLQQALHKVLSDQQAAGQHAQFPAPPNQPPGGPGPRPMPGQPPPAAAVPEK
jgi:hypothetical protein